MLALSVKKTKKEKKPFLIGGKKKLGFAPEVFSKQKPLPSSYSSIPIIYFVLYHDTSQDFKNW